MANDVLLKDGYKNSEDVRCVDGFVTILLKPKSFIGKGNYIKLCIQPEYDEPITLKDIAEKYPDVYMVIFEGLLNGEIYNYGNHKEGLWEKIGRTDGYA